MRLSSFLSVTSALLVLASCYEKNLEGPEAVSQFTIATSVPTMTLRPDSVTSFTVTVRNETRNQAVSPVGAFAESDAPSIVRVETTARPDSFKVTAITGGTARIIVGYTGTTGSARDTIVVTATPRPVATVSLTPDSTGVFVGATTTLRAALLDAAGDTIRQRTATFSSVDTTIATVSSAGVVTGVRVGTATIVATREEEADTSRVTVTLRPVNTVTVAPADTTVRVGNNVQLTATLRAANNAVVTGRTVTWASSDTTIATVNGSGRVTGVAASAQFVTITATSEGKSGSARVIVVP
ncbi:MAG TPA: Ig-like domain-containing protein [Gemmatimonadaceae bacterium]|nr:Ig-like domain-containing protein [Gemmatimonadaceae bacterium]